MIGVYDRKTDMFVQVVPENYEDVFLAVRPEQALQCAAWDDPNAADDMCREGERLPEAAGRDLDTWFVPEPEADKAGGKPDKPDWQFPETVTREMLESFIQMKEGSTRPLVGKIDGHKYIVKFGDSTGDDHVRCEVEGDRFIRAAGFNAPRSRIYEVDWWGKGKNTTIRLSEYIEDAVALKDAYKYFPEWNWKVKQQLLAAYPVLAVMANTDAFHNDNVLVDARGNVWYVDNGSSFCYRATGSLKLPKTGFSYNYFKRTDPKAEAKDGGIMSLYEYSDQLKTILGRLTVEDVLHAAYAIDFGELAETVDEEFNCDAFKEYCRNLDQWANEKYVEDMKFKYRFFKGETDNPFKRNEHYSRHFFWGMEWWIQRTPGAEEAVRWNFETISPDQWPDFMKDVPATADERALLYYMYTTENRLAYGDPESKKRKHCYGIERPKVDWELYLKGE